ncbi:major histocompatibility complex class I-related gene protein-like, partial [Conger conger]|uniref:major histocompatibility complex class I-related gene protein-like n=1 Tax=Conger conger TaxID=82655 RepID=UPI002A5AF6D7
MLIVVQDGFHTVTPSPFQHLCVWHSVLPSDAKDLLKASYKEGLQASEVVAVDDPCLTSIHVQLSDASQVLEGWNGGQLLAFYCKGCWVVGKAGTHLTDGFLGVDGTHSLWYFVTFTAGPSPFPEMVLLGMVDDILVEQYDSVSKKMSPQQDWQKEEDSVAYAEMKRIGIADITDSLKARLQYMREHFNHSVTLHTYQRFAGCELDDDGTERFKAQDAYNGKDVLSFDTQAAIWSTPFPEMQKDSWAVQTYKGLSYHVYQSLCVRLLKSFLQQGGSILKRRVKPKIRVLQKQVGSAGAVEVTCLAMGFYPR